MRVNSSRAGIRAAAYKETPNHDALTDPHSWLEDSESPKVKRWILEQNDITNKVLDGAAREDILGRIKKYSSLGTAFEDPGPSSEPLPSGKYRYFEFGRLNGEEYRILYYKDGMDGELKVAIDPNKFDKDGKISLYDYFPNADGTKIAYLTSERGSDICTINVLDLEKGKVLREKIKNVTFSDVVWNSDGTGFYYTNWPNPSVYKDPERVSHIFFHQLGTSIRRDEKVFGKGLGASMCCYLESSTYGGYRLIYVSDNVNNDVYFIRPGGSVIRPLVTGMDGESSVLDIVGNKAYVLTSLGAPNYRVVSIDIRDPSKGWRTIIPEMENAVMNASMTNLKRGNKIFLNYIENGCSDIKVFSMSGKLLSDVKLPCLGYATTPVPDLDGKRAFFTIGSPISPAQNYVLDLRTYDVEKLKRNIVSIHQEVDFDFSKIEMNRIFYKSKDGTEIPMFIIKMRDVPLDGNNTLILYGYGGFNLSVIPGFSPRYLPFLEDGGIYVMTNIRGGGEFGRDWYDGGRHVNKQKSFDDFIAAGEWLIANKYTNNDKGRPGGIIAYGRSNGGLLVAAASVQRPDLFKGVICEMPAIHMEEADKTDIGMLCRGEYGDPRNAEELKFIKEYSPYTNIKNGNKFPPMLVITGENDTRTHPMHGRKFGAKVAAAHPDNLVLHMTIMDTGHGGETIETQKTKELEWSSYRWAFAYKVANNLLSVETVEHPDSQIIALRRIS